MAFRAFGVTYEGGISSMLLHFGQESAPIGNKSNEDTDHTELDATIEPQAENIDSFSRRCNCRKRRSWWQKTFCT